MYPFTQMNSALLKVQTSAEQLLRLYQSQDTRTTSNSTHKLFLSSLSQNKYHDSENELMKQLTKYAKKQFFPVSKFKADTYSSINPHTHSHINPHIHSSNNPHTHSSSVPLSFQGIADMVQTLSDKTQCTILDLTETDNVIQSKLYSSIFIIDP